MGGGDQEEQQFDRRSSSSFTHRLRSSFHCFSCCFNGSTAEEEAPAASLLRSSSGWVRDRAREIPAVVSKFSRNRKASGDFGTIQSVTRSISTVGREDGDAGLAQAEMLRFKSFSARLPATSPSVRDDPRERSSAVRPH